MDNWRGLVVPCPLPIIHRQLLIAMHPSQMHYFPLTWPFGLALFVVFAVVVALIELGILRYAFAKVGVESRYIIGLLFLSLLGSSINIPILELPAEQVVSDQIVQYAGVYWIVPAVQEWPRTVIAINVGGAVIPIILSIGLLVQHNLYLRGLLATLIVALVVHWLAQPIKGVGIAVPTFIPPVVAAASAMLLAWNRAAPLAYIAGSLGTLIGADLMNLDKLRGLGAPVASIGGAGTFDGIFVAGVLAVLLIPSFGLPTKPTPPVEPPTSDAMV